MSLLNKCTSVFLATLMLLISTGSAFAATDTIFTLDQLTQFDGKGDHRAYYAYEGLVYDVTGSPLWKAGEHFGLQAGRDLTGEMDEAPHGIEVFVGFKVVGVLEGHEDLLTTESFDESAVSQPWYMGRITIFGQSILGWTGILLGLTFIFTFGTCFAMPWARAHVPWTGSKPGNDPLDKAGTHMPLTSIHKYFVWYTIIFGIIHGVIGVLQMFGIYL